MLESQNQSKGGSVSTGLAFQNDDNNKEDKEMAKKSTIRDIFNGKIISCWEDDQIVWLCFPFCDVKFLKEDWEDVKKELRQLAKR